MKLNKWKVLKTMAILCLPSLSVIALYHLGAKVASNDGIGDRGNVIVIDAGHGGADPGKVGVNNALEKEINLEIAFHLKSFLEQNGYEVRMTRTEDAGLYSDSDSNKKAADLRKRIQLIQEANPVIAISIHQNSFGQESSRGAQVFYHAESEEGKKMAEAVQEQMKKSLNDGNRRVAKSNDSYYMLKHAECPFVIVECGFLSNREEAELLCDARYQEKVAWAIHLGVLAYLNQK